MILDVVDSGYYSIIAKTNVVVEALINNVPADDIVDPDTKQCYSYSVSNNRTDVQFMFQTYSGNGDMRLNLLEIPSDWNDF